MTAYGPSERVAPLNAWIRINATMAKAIASKAVSIRKTTDLNATK